MKDYQVSVKVRNNRLLKAIEDSGGTPGGKWCEANGVTYFAVNRLINMTISPLNADGHLSKTAEKLCDILNKTPEGLWSNEQLYPLEKNFSEMEMSHEQVVALLPQVEQTYMLDESGVEHRQRSSAINKALAKCTEREREVIRLRFEEDKTLAEIGKLIGGTQERIRQIEAKVMWKLRNPVHELKEHV